MRNSLALTVALLGLAVHCEHGPFGEQGLPGDDWNDGAGAGGCRGATGTPGVAAPKPTRPYLKSKKGRSNAYYSAPRSKSNSR